MLLFFDTETCGLPRKWELNDIDIWPRTVQLAWALYDDSGNRQSLNNVIIYPTDFTIPSAAAAIHGITTDRAKKEGTSLHKVLPQFNTDVEKSSRIIAHNLDFDLPVVMTEFKRCKMETALQKKERFCTMKTQDIVNYCKCPQKSGSGYKWPSLNELHVHLFEEGFTGSHNAGADVEACAKCYFELRKRGIIV
jgi:DNA polymerase III subunit epsilon